MSSPRSFATAKIQQIFVICKELTIKMEFTHIFSVFLSCARDVRLARRSFFSSMRLRPPLVFLLFQAHRMSRSPFGCSDVGGSRPSRPPSACGQFLSRYARTITSPSRPSYSRLVAQCRKRCRPARDALNAGVAHAECMSISADCIRHF